MSTAPTTQDVCFQAIEQVGACFSSKSVSVDTVLKLADAVCAPAAQAMFPTPEMAQNACYAATTLVAVMMPPNSTSCEQLLQSAQCNNYDCMQEFVCSGGADLQQCSREMMGTTTGLCRLYTDMAVAMEGRTMPVAPSEPAESDASTGSSTA